ncbi:hypothetical protein Indivirus_12_9 [Indivirus ILV1]|uniref:Uncharacterized protein n=1 Tax=Indivirus ILV1 TaxID=1977633 RepID=A0A1V0SEH0_9VIRU|nr:hypothetical protein Indivirus_12_9 [Indivirus ILV1]
MHYLPLIGAFSGIVICFLNIASMEGVVTRPDQNGDMKFSIVNIIEYIKMPFDLDKRDVAWPTYYQMDFTDRVKLLSLNWVIMAGIGAGIGASIDILL